MSESPEQPVTRPDTTPPAAGAEKSPLATLVVQLFVIPLAVVLFCVALGALFMWLTSERKDFQDYVRSLRASSGTRRSQQAQHLLAYIQESKRWQGIFDVTARISADQKQFLAQHPQAVPELIAIFTEARGQDAKTRRYLALVLGLLGDATAAPALTEGLADSDPDVVKNCLWALGNLGVDTVAPRVIELTRHEDQSVRLMAVYVLGTWDHPQGRAVLLGALNDPDDLVKWNAAFGLAARGDATAVPVLRRLLDKEYVDRFTAVTPENRQRYRIAAVDWVAQLDRAEDVGPLLERLSVTDPDLRVRNAALQQVNQLNKQRN